MARDQYLHVRVDGREKKVVLDAARLTHLSEASWIRMVLLEAAEKAIKLKENKA